MTTLIVAQENFEIAQNGTVESAQLLNDILVANGVERSSLIVTVPGKVYRSVNTINGLIGLQLDPDSQIVALSGEETLPSS